MFGAQLMRTAVLMQYSLPANVYSYLTSYTKVVSGYPDFYAKWITEFIWKVEPNIHWREGFEYPLQWYQDYGFTRIYMLSRLIGLAFIFLGIIALFSVLYCLFLPWSWCIKPCRKLRWKASYWILINYFIRFWQFYILDLFIVAVLDTTTYLGGLHT